MPEIALAEGTDMVKSNHGAGGLCGSELITATGVASQTKVTVGGIPVVVENDIPEPHPTEGCMITDTSPLSTYSSKVSIGGKAVGRKGDMYISGNEINEIMTGSAKVTCG